MVTFRQLILLALFSCANFFMPMTLEAIDIQANNSDLAAVVTSIARSEHLNIVGTETLTGKITTSLYDVSPLEALHLLGEKQHFSVREENGTIFVEGRSQFYSQGEPFVISPKHLRPDKIGEAISAIIPKEKMKVLKETNQLIAYGTKEEQRQVVTMLQNIDQAPKQVHLTATVFALEGSYIKETGLSWSWLGLTGHGEDTTNSYGAVRFGRAGKGDSYKFFYRPELHAMESSGKLVLVAQPNIMTINGEEAKILIGDRVPVLVENKENGQTSTSVRYEEAGIRLTYTPYLTEDDYIDAEVHAEVSTPTLVPELKAYKITTREGQTRVRLKAGEVLVIGGLMDNRKQSQRQKIPLLGDIPLLGKLFQHARKTKDTVELFILLKAEKIESSK